VGFWLMFQPPLSARRVASIDGLATVNELSEVNNACVTRSIGAAVDASEGTDSKVLTVRGRTKDLAALAKTVTCIESTVAIRYD
jgi:hypothetical protein